MEQSELDNKDIEEVMDEAEDAGETASDISPEAVKEAEAAGVKLKDQFKGIVKKLSLAGALIDIQKEMPAVLHISQIPRGEGKDNSNKIHDLLQVGQEIDCWVKKVKDGRIELTMIQPLALEWREIKKDMVAKGTVLRMEKFGAFIEIGAERPGLVHISEIAHSYVRQPSDMLKEGDVIEAKVLEVNRRKKQIKLSMKALQPLPEETREEEETKAAPSRPASVRAQQLKEGKINEPREKSEKTREKSKRVAKKREEINQDFSIILSGNDNKEEAEPTAMEIAWREAMEKAKARKQQSDDKKKKGVSAAQQDILNRTLSNKVG